MGGMEKNERLKKERTDGWKLLKYSEINGRGEETKQIRWIREIIKDSTNKWRSG